ncbi:DUF317 domain-containing protein [Streptomyces prunicolor]|uniref:DUF317 domain-containing protein n=1 Tax=Streptomyces prunicolor TaxID=67348 RepID=UPI0022509334|nr:DUF317 domain-containing protein [Streptomyces prunicolor]MCX5238845.1 DUF317 domain-containing protein [Streptomyces prunicolor]
MSRFPDERVEVDYVAPRHLAGGGDPTWITVPLHRACGWSPDHEPLTPNVVLTSPDQKALLRLEPDPDSQWWTLHHAPEPTAPAWYASFGARTPVEFIAAVTDALTDPDADTAAAPDPFEVLRQANWIPTGTQNGLVSRDGTAFVQRSHDASPWIATVMFKGYGTVWQAHFGERTPPRLISAFTASMTDPSPVARILDTRRLPTLNPNLVTRTQVGMRAGLVAFALEDRVRTLSARHTPPASPPSAPPGQPPGRSR